MSTAARPLGPLGAPPFAQVRDEDFLPALTTAIGWHEAEIATIAGQDAPADGEAEAQEEAAAVADVQPQAEALAA